MYRVNLQTNLCEPPTKLTDPFQPIGVPQDATFYGIDFLGAEVSNLGVRVDQFHHRDEQSKEKCYIVIMKFDALAHSRWRLSWQFCSCFSH